MNNILVWKSWKSALFIRNEYQWSYIKRYNALNSSEFIAWVAAGFTMFGVGRVAELAEIP